MAGADAETVKRNTRVLGLVLAVVVFAVGSAGMLTRLRGWPHQSSALGFVAIVAAMFAAAEILVVHVQLGRDTHTFSMSEIPLIVATFLLSPVAALAAATFGHGVALTFYRRQRPSKLLFNMARVIIELSISIGILRVLGTARFLPSTRDLLAVFTGVIAASIVGGLLVSAAIVASQGPLPKGAIRANLTLSVIGTSASGSLGLLTLVLVRADPTVTWVLLMPAVGGYALYNALARSRRQNDSLQFLFEAGQLLHENADFDKAIPALLERTREALGCDVAELVHLVGPDGFCVRALVSIDTAPRFWSEVADPRLVASVSAKAPTSPAPGQPGAELLACFTTGAAARPSLIAGLSANGVPVGLLLIAGPLGEVASMSQFDDEKARLLGTIAQSLSIALENGALERSLDQLRVLERELDHKAHHDTLTGLANRALFGSDLASAVSAFELTGEPFATLFLDLDDFKTVNDSLGHDAGDALLISIAERLRRCVTPQDTIARLGGDEFAIVATAVDGVKQAEALAASILAILDEPVTVAGHLLSVSASIGIAMGRAGADVVEILKSADVAMYNAKAGGKRRYAVFNPVTQREVLARYELADGIKRAAELGQLRLYLQPIVDLASGSVVSAESLVRWQHPNQGLLDPEQFIALAEENGAVRQITRFVITHACHILTRLPRSTLPSVAVNVSALDLQDDDMVDFLLGSIVHHKIEPDRFTIEVTESVLLDQHAPKALSVLRLNGVRVSLDDFGTGYSSLAALRSLPIDELKLAKPFVDDLTDAPRSGEFIRAITSLANSLGLETVAEGIEQIHQPDMLQSLGCHRGQGYLFARPMPEASFDAWLLRHPVGSERADAPTQER